MVLGFYTASENIPSFVLTDLYGDDHSPSPRDGSPTAWEYFGVFHWHEGLPEFVLLAGMCWRSMLKKLLLANKTNTVNFKIESVPEPWNEICVSSVCV